MRILPIAILALVLIIGAFVLLKNQGSQISGELEVIPKDYYFSLKKADANSPIELIRFASSIRPYTSDFSIQERVAFFEWYLKNRGFNVSFAYSNDFRNAGKEHVWLVVRNQLGESMAVEPSSIELDADSISPTTPEYKRYQKQFNDIYELSKNTGGAEKYAWWRTNTGQKLLNESILLLKKKQL